MLFLADCGVVPDPNVEQLASIAVQTGLIAGSFRNKSRIAMLSFSTKGSAKTRRPRRSPAPCHRQRTCGRFSLEIAVDGEMQVDARSFPRLRSARRRPGRREGKRADFPDLNSGNIAAKLVQYLAGAAL